MDKNTWIGFLLIAAIIVGFSFFNKSRQPQQPTKAQVEQKRNQANQHAEQIAQEVSDSLNRQQNGGDSVVVDSISQEELEQRRIEEQFGDFAPAAQGEEGLVTIENGKVRLGIAYRGGYIAKAELKEYSAYYDKENYLRLFQGGENKIEYYLSDQKDHVVSTKDLYFTVAENKTDKAGNKTLVMRLNTKKADSYIDFVYTLPANDYMIGMSIRAHQMQDVLSKHTSTLQMRWDQKIPQQEKGRKFEEKYAQLQYMYMDGDVEKLEEDEADQKSESAKVKWVAHKDQYFSTVMIANDGFSSATMKSTPVRGRHIKQYNTTAHLPFDITGKKSTNLRYYIGPNHYSTLKAYDKGVSKGERLNLHELVPLGWKIVSWINKILVIPMFNLFNSWGLHIGIVILLMTLIIKLIILPFVFASYKSSAKMRVLRPQLEEINAQYPPEKMQERQKATIALYQRAGVNPMSGCLPMLFQFPVLMAMFWFLPTAIELRGKSLFWADDLSTYDTIISWDGAVPFLGDHLSLFCLLMTAVNIVYTHITMQSQAGGQEMKFMKWMMYLMPVMFLFIFNDYAAGLSFYYLVSLLFTIIQTMLFRMTIDDKKVLAEMEANAKKKSTQKKSGFMARLEAMQREQQRLARENAKAQQKKMR